MSAFDEWLTKNGKTRDTAGAVDEVRWLRLERQRLRLTDNETLAISTILDCLVNGYGPVDPISVGVALQELLNRQVEGNE